MLSCSLPLCCSRCTFVYSLGLEPSSELPLYIFLRVSCTSHLLMHYYCTTTQSRAAIYYCTTMQSRAAINYCTTTALLLHHYIISCIRTRASYCTIRIRASYCTIRTRASYCTICIRASYCTIRVRASYSTIRTRAPCCTIRTCAPIKPTRCPIQEGLGPSPWQAHNIPLAIVNFLNSFAPSAHFYQPLFIYLRLQPTCYLRLQPTHVYVLYKPFFYYKSFALEYNLNIKSVCHQ